MVGVPTTFGFRESVENKGTSSKIELRREIVSVKTGNFNRRKTNHS